MTPIRRRSTLALLAATAWTLGGCGNAERWTGTARVRLVNGSSGYASLDLVVAGDTVLSGVGQNTATGFAEVDAGDVTLNLRANGSGTNLSISTQTLADEASYTVVAYGAAGSLQLVVLQENEGAASSGYTKLRVKNLAAASAGSLDLYLTGTDDALSGATAVAASVADASGSAFTTVASGSYRLRVTAAGSKTDLRLDAATVGLSSGAVATLLITPGSGGVLVHALLVPQDAGVTPLVNTQARVRVVASLASTSAALAATVGGTSLLAVTASPAIGSYKLVTAGTQTASLTVGGSMVSSASVGLSAGGDYTWFVWGDAADAQRQWITDDNALPTDSASARLRLAHGLNDHADALSLSADAFEVVSNLAQGQVSDYVDVTANATMVLEVVSPTLGTVYPDSSSSGTTSSVPAKSLYTVWVLGSAATPRVYVRRDR